MGSRSMRRCATWASMIILRAQPGTGDRVQAHVKSSAASGASEELQNASRGGPCLPFFLWFRFLVYSIEERLYYGRTALQVPGQGRPLLKRPERGVGPPLAAETPRPGGVVSASEQEIGRGGGGSDVQGGGASK